MAHAPRTRLSATNERVKGPTGRTGLSTATSNGAAAGPPGSARQALRLHTVLQQLRREPIGRSRSPPTIVSWHDARSVEPSH
jgi:hypothetical protein